ncbi:MAG: hypothetical protein E6G60_16035 [Actinobacteria bacterium]|nr:MAG: hypothetical protein E6G60_16035 [Actinomycetota bacterium]
MTNEWLRPVERRVRRLIDAGVPHDEIARRFRHTSDWVRRVVALSEVPRDGASRSDSSLNPLERRVLRWRREGSTPAEIASRFRRSPRFIEQTERLARYKLGRS